jgi:hypothetical protein
MKTIQIHGKNYVPVSERIKEAGANLHKVETTIMQHEPVVVIKAEVTILDDKGFFKTYTGISSANPAKLIEKTNPYEVAETSAVGRALGFAGYGIDDGIASADEVTKYPEKIEDNFGDSEVTQALEKNLCKKHQVSMKLNKFGKPYHIANDEFCNGFGFPSEKGGEDLKDIAKKIDSSLGKSEEEIDLDDIPTDL